ALESTQEPQKESPESQEAAQEPQKESPEALESTQEPQKESPEALESTQEPQKESPESQEAAQEPQKESPEALESTQEPQKESPESQEAAQEPQKESPESQEAAQEPQTQETVEPIEKPIQPGEESSDLSNRPSSYGPGQRNENFPHDYFNQPEPFFETPPSMQSPVMGATGGFVEEPDSIPEISTPQEEPSSVSGEDKPPVQEIRGVLELKPPDQEDTPFLTLTYDFTRIPYISVLSKDHNIFEYAYYKYKPMLLKAHAFLKRKQITRALNYYRVIREQSIPREFKKMIDRNIQDITEYLEKYLMSRQD
ncbi:MAG: hypothetical protein OEZ13_11200, partial [Spirochaetia bacterium]|nr:hypothetical protein [Spirochaetia bacterium]